MVNDQATTAFIAYIGIPLVIFIAWRLLRVKRLRRLRSELFSVHPATIVEKERRRSRWREIFDFIQQLSPAEQKKAILYAESDVDRSFSEAIQSCCQVLSSIQSWHSDLNVIREMWSYCWSQDRPCTYVTLYGNSNSNSKLVPLQRVIGIVNDESPTLKIFTTKASLTPIELPLINLFVSASSIKDGTLFQIVCEDFNGGSLRIGWQGLFRNFYGVFQVLEHSQEGRDAVERSKKDGHIEQPETETRNNIDSAKAAGDLGEMLVREKLRTLKGSVINSFVATGNLKIEERNFEIDFVVFHPHAGLIILEVKYFQGNILYSSADEWQQITLQGEERVTRNYSKQATRAKSLLRKLLQAEGLKDWPIVAAVVFSHPKCTIQQVPGVSPQCAVIKIDDLETWLRSFPKKENHAFTKHDVDKIMESIKRYVSEYRTYE